MKFARYFSTTSLSLPQLTNHTSCRPLSNRGIEATRLFLENRKYYRKDEGSSAALRRWIPRLPMDFASTPVLANDAVRLEPLGHEHHDGLIAAASDGQLWRNWFTSIPSPESMQREIQRRLTLQQQDQMAPWAVMDPDSGSPLGMTTYMNLDARHRRVEVGSTWLAKSAQGTRINPGMKMLMLERAFTELGCIAVEFRTHWHNRQSRASISRLGAKQDGVLRRHQIMDNGTVRDTVVFSILDSEWPAVREGLFRRLEDSS